MAKAEARSLSQICEMLLQLGVEGYERDGNRCRGKGIVVSIVDVLLCAVVMKREWAIFASDPDFTNYAAVLPLTIHTPRK